MAVSIESEGKLVPFFTCSLSLSLHFSMTILCSFSFSLYHPTSLSSPT